MAQQEIKISVKTEVAALDRLHQKLEGQIAVARATGKEYAHLEKELVGVRSAMAKIPAGDRMKAGVQNGSPSTVMGGMNDWIKGAGAALLAGQGRKVLELADTIGTLRDATDASAQMLQVWREAATQTGNDAKMADKGIEKLNIRIGEAANGNKEAIKIFEDLGVKLDDDNKKLRSTDDLLKGTADAFKSIKDPAERARIAKKLFGDEAAKLAVTLSMGSDGFERIRGEMERFHKLLSDEEIAKLDRYDKRLKSMQTNITTGFGKGLAFFGSGFEGLASFLGGATGSVGPYDGMLKALSKLDFSAGLDALVEDVNELARTEAGREKIQRQLVQGAQDEAAAKQAALESSKESAEVMKQLKQDQAQRDSTEFQTIDEVIAAGGSDKASPSIKRDAKIAERVKFLRDKAEENRGFNPALAQRYKDRADQTERHIGSLAGGKKQLGDAPAGLTGYDAEVQKVIAESATAQAAAQKKANEQTIKAMEAGVENAEMTARRMLKLEGNFAELTKSLLNLQRKNSTTP